MWTTCTNCRGPFDVPTADEAHAPVRLCAACKFDERARVADPAYTPTLDEAMRNPDEFVAAMTEVSFTTHAGERPAPDLMLMLAACREFLALWPLAGYELEAYCDATFVPAIRLALAGK